MTERTPALWAKLIEGAEPVDESNPITSSDVNLAGMAAANERWGGAEAQAPQSPRHVIELDQQSYAQIMRLTVANMGDMTGLHQVIAETLESHPDWDDADGPQVCIGEGCDWVKGKNHTRDIAFRKHQTYQLFHAIKAAGFRKMFDTEQLGGDHAG